MCAFSDKRSTLTLATAGATVTSGFMAMPEARTEGFTDDSTLTGGIYYWQRERDRGDVTDGDKCKANLLHSTWNANLDSQFGYAADVFGLDIVASMTVEMVGNGDNSRPNEIAFSKNSKAYDEDWSGDKSGISPYEAATKFKYSLVWTRVGYIQSTDQTLLVPYWSFMSGTYQGAEAGVNFDYGDAGALSLSYMRTNEYKAPWHLEADELYQNGKTTKVDYLHSIGARYNFRNDFALEAAFGQAEGYIDQYFAKTSYKLDIAGSPLTTSYQFYDMYDEVDNRSVNDLRDGTTWLQALAFGYQAADIVDLCLEGIWIKADGQQRYFLQRMTPTYAFSNDRLNIWWDNRSGFSADGEKAVFSGAIYDLKNWNLPGFTIGAPYAYTRDAKPATWQGNPDAHHDKNRTIEESAYSLDVVYTIQDDRVKGTMLKLHFTEYGNHSDIPSWGGSYDSIFQGKRGMKFMVIAPFAIL